MVDTRYYCDKCGDRITPGDRTSYQARTGGGRHGPAVDLCGACERAFREWLGPGPGRDRMPLFAGEPTAIK